MSVIKGSTSKQRSAPVLNFLTVSPPSLAPWVKMTTQNSYMLIAIMMICETVHAQAGFTMNFIRLFSIWLATSDQ